MPSLIHHTWVLAIALGWGLPALAEPLAEVIDIPESPVFWSQPPEAESEAVIGTQVGAGGYLRTESPGKAQVQLADGLVFRLGGDAILELDEGDLNLSSGQIIAWVNPGNEGATRAIQLPMATAAIRGTTVFIDAQAEGCLIFSWEGEVEVTLTATGETVILNTGDELFIATEAAQLPAPAPMARAEVLNRFENSVLLHGFDADMSTLETIERELIAE